MSAEFVSGSFHRSAIPRSICWAWVLTLSVQIAPLRAVSISCEGEESPAAKPLVPGSQLLKALAPAELELLRDTVAYQICMGRDIETSYRQIEQANELKALEEKGSVYPLVAAMYAQLTTAPELPPDRPRALALIGDRYHHPGYIRPPLEAACSKAGVAVTFIYDVRLFNPQVLNHYDLLIILRDGMLWPEPSAEDPFGKKRVFWLTSEQEQTLASFLCLGRAYLALHNATALKDLRGEESLYREILGASYAGHGTPGELYEVEVVDRAHPVAHLVKNFWVTDERHWPTVHAADAKVFLEATVAARTCVHGFTRHYGQGRICYLANGHYRDVLESPPMQQLMANAIRWCVAPGD